MRRREKFTQTMAGDRFIQARREGFEWGLTHSLNDDGIFQCPYIGVSSWMAALECAWRDGRTDGRNARRKELLAVCGDELTDAP